jgi:hypothetical protein
VAANTVADRGDAADDSAGERAAQLNAAGTRLCHTIAELSRVILSGDAIERDGARDRFEIALSEYSALIEDTA